MGELVFSTTPKKRKIIPFEIDGRTLEFTVPKKAIATMGVLDGKMGAYLNVEWLGAGLSDKDQEYIAARLRDPKDDFDIDEIKKICEGLIAEASDRPTTPLPDSGQRPNTSGKISTGRQRKKDSTR